MANGVLMEQYLFVSKLLPFFVLNNNTLKKYVFLFIYLFVVHLPCIVHHSFIVCRGLLFKKMAYIIFKFKNNIFFGVNPM